MHRITTPAIRLYPRRRVVGILNENKQTLGELKCGNLNMLHAKIFLQMVYISTGV